MMRTGSTFAIVGAVALLLTACEKTPPPPPPSPDSNLPSVNDIESPKADAPVIDAASYDKGYDAGMDAGEAAARKLPPRSRAPTAEDAKVVALEAAGSDATRAEQWQKGFSSGYREGFSRISTGKK